MAREGADKAPSSPSSDSVDHQASCCDLCWALCCRAVGVVRHLRSLGGEGGARRSCEADASVAWSCLRGAQLILSKELA